MGTLKVNDKVTIVEDYFDLTDEQDFKRDDGDEDRLGTVFFEEKDFKDRVFTVYEVDEDGDIILNNENGDEVGYFFPNVLQKVKG